MQESDQAKILGLFPSFPVLGSNLDKKMSGMFIWLGL